MHRIMDRDFSLLRPVHHSPALGERNRAGGPCPGRQDTAQKTRQISPFSFLRQPRRVWAAQEFFLSPTCSLARVGWLAPVPPARRPRAGDERSGWWCPRGKEGQADEPHLQAGVRT